MYEIVTKALQMAQVDAQFKKLSRSPFERIYIFGGGFYTSAQLRKVKEYLTSYFGQCTIDQVQGGGFAVKIPLEEREFVPFKKAINAIKRPINKSSGVFNFGKSANGDCVTSLKEATHLLIAGTTGSGKSSLLHSIILQLLLYSDAKLVLIDPKGGAEFGIYDRLYKKGVDGVALDDVKAMIYLNGAVALMEERYRQMAIKNQKQWTNSRFVFIIDELADLMLSTAYRQECEQALIRIAQKGRAAGIHLIVATQDPRTQVVTGLLKNNLPTKICLKTANARHSMNVIDCGLAANLLGKGDAYLKMPNTTAFTRVQTPFVTDAEINTYINYKKNQY